MEINKKKVDREQLEKPLAAMIDAGAEMAMFGLKYTATAQEQMVKSSRIVIDQATSAMEQSRHLAEELVGINKKFATDMMKYWLDAWVNVADAYKLPEPKPAVGGDKKSA